MKGGGISSSYVICTRARNERLGIGSGQAPRLIGYGTVVIRNALPSAVQERSRQRIRDIIAAGLRLLENGGSNALTIAAVAKEANVAIGSVYQRFGTKEQLLAEIQAEFTESFLVEFKDRMAKADLKDGAMPDQLVKAAVTAFAETFRVHANLLRVFVLLGTENIAVREVGAHITALCQEAFSELLIKAKPAIKRDDPAMAVDHAFRVLYASCIYQVVHGGEYEAGVPTSWQVLNEQLSLMVTLYLFSDVAFG